MSKIKTTITESYWRLPQSLNARFVLCAQIESWDIIGKSYIGMAETKGIIFLSLSIKPARDRYAWKANIFWETAHLPLP